MRQTKKISSLFIYIFILLLFFQIIIGAIVSGMEAVEKLAIGEPPSNPDKMVSVRLGKK